MGNDNSKPVNERIHIGVVEDNPAGIQALIESLPNYPAHDANELQWMDKRGRTPLTVAAKRGHLKCANVLLQGGVDINFMNRLPETMGTALHEAIHEKHERMSELLLISGANPFLANSYGSTALDVALQVNFGPMIQRLKAMATHIDTASFKVPTFGGMSTGFKPKFLVLVPYHPFSKSNGHQKITKQLLIFNDAKSTTVRSRIWMHLSSLKTKDGAVVLHLAPSHPHPGDDFVTTFDRGHCLFLKEENPIPDAMERFKKLLTILKEASAVTTVTTKAQPNDSIALKSDSSAASFNSSGTLTDSSKSRPPAALDSGHLADNSGSGDLKAPTKPIHKEYARASPEGRSLPSSPLREQQLQQVDQHQHQQQQQQQQHTPFSVEKAKEHHHSQSFSDLNGSQPPSAMNSARSTPHKRSNSIWSKSDVQAAVTTPTPPSKQAGTHEPAAPAEAAAAVTQHPLATAAETGLGTATPGSAVGQSVGGAATVTTPMDVCRHAAASPANHAAAAASPANHAAAAASPANHAAAAASPANHAAAAASPANHAAAAASPANHAAAAASPAHHAAAAASPANHAAAAASPANHAAAASPDGSACSSMSLKADEDAAQPLQALQKKKAAAIQEQLWAVEEKKLGIQEQRLRYHLEQEEQAASEESKKKAGEIKQQLWAIEERKLVIQEERLRFQLQQEA